MARICVDCGGVPELGRRGPRMRCEACRHQAEVRWAATYRRKPGARDIALTGARARAARRRAQAAVRPDLPLCACGCGQRVSVSTSSGYRRRLGAPNVFVRGHRAAGAAAPGWRGGRTIHNGYVELYQPDHPNADRKGYVQEHVAVVAAVLGKPVPAGCPIHHANQDRGDNRRSNLVLCDSHGYHKLLHQRLDALKACGHASWRKCSLCQEYGDPATLYQSPNNGACRHRACVAAYGRIRKRGEAFSYEAVRRERSRGCDAAA